MKVLTNNQYYSQIADVIREQNGTSNTYTPPQMVNALKDLFYEEVEGVPPINFQGIGENLLDYKIDGASGGVGDRTGNLFEGEWTQGGVSTAGGIDNENQLRIKAIIPVMPSQTYTIRTNLLIRMIYAYNNTTLASGRISKLLDAMDGVESAVITIPTDANLIAISLKKSDNSNVTPSNVEWTMLNFGSQPLPYEPYGYKVPVVCGGTTTNIYLDKPIEAKANIPSEYEEVEYIESTGTQYINTGFKLNTNCRIVFDYYLTTLGSFSPFGSYQKENQNPIGFTAYTVDNTSRFGTFLTKNLTGNYNQYQINNRAHFEYSKNGLYQNGSLVYSITTNDAVSNYNCFIFARNANDVATGLGNIRLYYFKIYDNDSLVRNLIPCYRKSDNKPGMYDTITETFFTNSGTGNFIVGSIKENESITLSDTNVDIPTIRGTNVLTVDTTVQPSNVYVKSRHESSYETAMRERYEEAQAQLDALN